MKDSNISGVKGPGQVDGKQFRTQGVWGTLPEKEQAKAKNIINRRFPYNYQDAIDAYSKKMADRKRNSSR